MKKLALLLMLVVVAWFAKGAREMIREMSEDEHYGVLPYDPRTLVNTGRR